MGSEIAALSIRLSWVSTRGDECVNGQCIYAFFQELNFLDPHGQSILLPGQEKYVVMPEPTTFGLLLAGLVGVFASRHQEIVQHLDREMKS